MKIAVMGAGAVGCYFGFRLARGGNDVTLIGRPQLVEAVQRQGLRLESQSFDECVRVSASTDVCAVEGAELVLFCVKSPDTESAASAIGPHLDYLGQLAERRRWLGGDQFTMADIVACAHISAVDYVGDVPWDQYPAAKDWYAKLKSRPSVRPLLTDNLPGIPPSAHYANLDF